MQISYLRLDELEQKTGLSLVDLQTALFDLQLEGKVMQNFMGMLADSIIFCCCFLIIFSRLNTKSTIVNFCLEEGSVMKANVFIFLLGSFSVFSISCLEKIETPSLLQEEKILQRLEELEARYEAIRNEFDELVKSYKAHDNSFATDEDRARYDALLEEGDRLFEEKKTIRNS